MRPAPSEKSAKAVKLWRFFVVEASSFGLNQRKGGMDSQQPWPPLWRRFQHWWTATQLHVRRADNLPFLHDAHGESPEFMRAVTLIRAIDAGGVPLNPMRVNDIARKLGLEVSGAAPMDETIERIRTRLLDTHAGATTP